MAEAALAANLCSWVHKARLFAVDTQLLFSLTLLGMFESYKQSLKGEANTLVGK